MTSPLAEGLKPIRRALISVTDKNGIVALCQYLLNNRCNCITANGAEGSDSIEHSCDIELLSTGGTYKLLKQHGIAVREVSEVTGFKEILGGRVKTIHPKIHAGLLSIRENPLHQKSMIELELPYIDLVVVNLYQFEKFVMRQKSSECSLDPCKTLEVIDQIDIGGQSLIRSAAKNFNDVVCISSVDQYPQFYEELKHQRGYTSLRFRQQLALEAFKRTSEYDSTISKYFESIQLPSDTLIKSNCPEFSSWQSSYQVQPMECIFPLKYGLNPHQQPSCLFRPPSSNGIPFTVINGRPGYINLLDAINAWQLVIELSKSIPGSPPAAASFKHVSPAGVALGRSPITNTESDYFDLTDSMRQRLGISDDDNSNQSNKLTKSNSLIIAALIRARHCDPLCSFGDFIALSCEVDETAALFLKTEVSDGIIAAGYTEEALHILKQKKSKNYVILQGNPDFSPPVIEYRELYGIGLAQRRNDVDPLGQYTIITNNERAKLTSEVTEDIRLAAITLKYTQSNSVCLAQNGQAIGVAAGQQSRVDAVKLATRKAKLWQLRHHNQILRLPFKAGLKRQDRINGRVAFVEACHTGDKSEWFQYFEQYPELLSNEEMDMWTKQMSYNTNTGSVGHIPLSDGFFPFRDSIDVMAKSHVQWVMHPGGSIADETIKLAASSYRMGLIESHVRLFVH